MLVYFSVNNHMYWISNSEAAMSLAKKAREMDVHIQSIVIDMNETETEKQNPYKMFPIVEDIAIENLADYKDHVVIYDKCMLNEELDEIIRIHGKVPQIRNKHYDVISMCV